MKSISKAAVALGALLAVSGSAIAADIDMADPAYDWSGFYLGAQTGYLWGDGDTYAYVAAGTILRRGEQKADSWLGGLYAGYNWQPTSGVVFGVDADFAFMNANSGLEGTVTAAGGPGGANFHGTDVDWTSAFRLRAGFTADRFMPYLAGGLALAGADFDFDHAADAGSMSKTLVGFTVGGGFEWAATDNIIFRTEYRYTDYGKSTRGHVFPLFPTEFQKGAFSSHDVRVGLAWKF